MPYIKTDPKNAILKDPQTGDYVVFSWDAARATDTTEKVALRYVSSGGHVDKEWELVRRVARELWVELVQVRGWTRYAGEAK
jgi:hypothetical protein